jgi:hypothetical protein
VAPVCMNRGSHDAVWCDHKISHAASAPPEGRAHCEASYGRQNEIIRATRLNIQSDIAAQLNCQRGPVWFSTCNGETMRAQEESSKPQEPCGPLDALPCHLPTAGEREVTRQPNSLVSLC